MKKYDLLRFGDSIIRVLEIQDDRILVIDCIKHSMPVWVESPLLESYFACANEELFGMTGFSKVDIDALDTDQRKVMYERYTMITPILLFLSNDKMRSRLICSIAEEHKVSKQTIRNYLCLYLSYLDVTVLAPKKRKEDRELTQDEKHMRWALNKFFYTTKKQSLMTAYTMMLKEKYCDARGVLAEEYPSFYQFRYFYRKIYQSMTIRFVLQKYLYVLWHFLIFIEYMYLLRCHWRFTVKCIWHCYGHCKRRGQNWQYSREI